MLVAVVAVGALLRVWGLWFGLPHAQARPDESVAIGHGIRIAQGDLNPHFFDWPSLHLYVLAAIYTVSALLHRLAGLADDVRTFAHYAIPGRAYVAVAGTLTILALYRLARQVAGPAQALAAALFLAVAPLHVRDSHFAMTDVTMTLLVTVSLWLLLDGSRRIEAAADRSPARRIADGLGTFALAGVVGGLAASTKYNAAAVLAAAGFAQVWVVRHVASRWRLVVWAPLASFVACFAVGFVAATPYAVLDFANFRTGVLFTMTHLSQGHGPNLGRGWSRHLRFSLPYGLGVPLFVAGLGGAIAAARYNRRSVSILAAFVVASYASVGGGYTVFARYTMPLIPLLCLSAALLVDSLAARVAARFAWRPGLVLAVATALVTLPSLASSVQMVALLARTDSRVLAARWLTQHLPRDATLHETGREYVRLEIESPRLHSWYFDPQTGHFVGATPDMLPQWLVIHESPVLEYTSVPPPIARLVRDRYRLVKTFTATTSGSRPADYDQQDAFFLPLRNFGSVLRPGTNISVYMRRDSPGGGGGLSTRSMGIQVGHEAMTDRRERLTAAAVMPARATAARGHSPGRRPTPASPSMKTRDRNVRLRDPRATLCGRPLADGLAPRAASVRLPSLEQKTLRTVAPGPQRRSNEHHDIDDYLDPD